MPVKYIIPLVVLITLLTVIIPATQVEGASVKADFTITASKIIRPDVHKYEWETYVNEKLSFDASDSTSAKNFTWDFGDGKTNTTTSKFTSHSYSSTGRFQITLTVSDNNGNSDKIYGNITIVDRPLAVLVVKDAETGESLAPDYTVQVGDKVLFDGSGSKGDIKSYYFGYNLRSAFIPQASKNDPTYTYTYTAKGDYKVGLRVVDRLGNKSETPKEQFITIHVKEKSSSSGSSFNLPVSLPILLGGIGLVVVLAIVGVLYHLGYIGPFMIGVGSTKKKEEEKSGEGTVDTSELDSMLKPPVLPEKEKPSIPDLPDLASDSGLPPEDMEEKEEEKTVYEVKTCPKCGGKIPITSLERPLKVTCPDCGASFTLKAKPGAKKATAGAGAAARKKAVKKAQKKETVYEVKTCPKCGGKIPITSLERPLKVRCPDCGASFTLKAKPGAKMAGAKKRAPAGVSHTHAVSHTHRTVPAEDTEIVICPSCGKALPVPAGATSVKCDACGTEFDI